MPNDMLNSRPCIRLVRAATARRKARILATLAPLLCAASIGALVVASPLLAGLCGIVGAYLLAKEG